MKKFNWKAGIGTILVLLVPVFAFPAVGTSTNGTALCSYGFPFNWLTFYFQGTPQNLYVWQCFSGNNGYYVNPITLVINLVIVYTVIMAVARFIWKNRREVHKQSWM